MTNVKFILAILLLALFPMSAHAHLSAGEDVASEGFEIDFGYDPARPTEGDVLAIAFELRDAESDAPTEFTHAWVSIKKSDTELFAAPLAQDAPGRTSAIVPLSQSGDLTVAVRFHNGLEVLSEHAFTVPVAAATTPENANGQLDHLPGVAYADYLSYALAILNVILLIAVAVLALRKKNPR